MPQKKKVLNGVDAREKILKGADFLADTVKLTLGRDGKNAIIGPYVPVKITNDGHRIAKELMCADELEQLGLAALREATSKTNEEAGDGTTTATVLAQAILHTMSSYLASKGTFASKRSPRALIAQLNKERDEVIEKLTVMSVPIKDKEHLIDVARVSVEDDELATMIGGMQFDIGPKGTILAEESNDGKDEIERVVGVRIDNGYGTSRMINNIEKQTLEVKDCVIILTNHVLHNLDGMGKVLQDLVKKTKNIVVVGRAFDDNCLLQIQKNMEQGINVYAINAPYVDQVEVMEDLAALTGGTFFNSETRKLEDMQLSDVGRISKIVAGRFTGIVTGIDDEPSRERIAARIEKLRTQLKGESSTFYKSLIESRISQLSGGFGILKVGAATITERNYKKDKADDAVNAVRSALQEGVVPGAGLAFKIIAETMPDDSLLKKALLAPHAQIMANAEEEFEVESWVQDSVKVLRIALTNACSVAGTIATTGIAINKENDKPRYVAEAKDPQAE